MPIQHTCDCGKKLNIPDHLAGRKVKCPGCGGAVEVSGAAATQRTPSENLELDILQGQMAPKRAAATRTSSPTSRPSAPVSRSSAPSPLLKANMKDCPFCGEAILTTAKKCKHCKEFLDIPSPAPASVIPPADASTAPTWNAAAWNAPMPATTGATLRADGVVECWGDYTDCFNKLKTAMIQTGGKIKREDAGRGVLEASWRYGINLWGIRVTGTLRCMDGGCIQILLEGGLKDAFDTFGHAEEKKILVLQAFMQKFGAPACQPPAMLPHPTAPVGPRGGNNWIADVKADKRATSGLILGLIATFLWLLLPLGLGLFCSFMAIVFSCLGLGSSRKGSAVIGLILGIIMFLFIGMVLLGVASGSLYQWMDNL